MDLDLRGGRRVGSVGVDGRVEVLGSRGELDQMGLVRRDEMGRDGMGCVIKKKRCRVLLAIV